MSGANPETANVGSVSVVFRLFEWRKVSDSGQYLFAWSDSSRRHRRCAHCCADRCCSASSRRHRRYAATRARGGHFLSAAPSVGGGTIAAQPPTVDSSVAIKFALGKSTPVSGKAHSRNDHVHSARSRNDTAPCMTPSEVMMLWIWEMRIQTRTSPLLLRRPISSHRQRIILSEAV